MVAVTEFQCRLRFDRHYDMRAGPEQIRSTNGFVRSDANSDSAAASSATV
jgi:hypothetical protein